MPEDAASAMKARLRADLRAALKEGRSAEAKLVRALVAALDNAEAPPVEAGRGAADRHRFRDGSAEVERLLLDGTAVRDVLSAEIRERERAAMEMEHLGKTDHAEVLRAEALLARRYTE